jgi:cohesin complex subunit SA-1/2
MQQNISDYPLIHKAKSSHAFREALVDFFEALIKAMAESGVMYEDVALIENIHLWVATMTSSTSRPFRHTSTLIALTIMTSMCAVAQKEINVAAAILRQLNSEKKSKRQNKARLADFQNKITASEKKTDFLQEKIKDFFDTVYVHRYRDVDPKIRIECVEALGNWMVTMSSLFLDGQYLRYMGWMLSDTYAPMRQEDLKQLIRIMKNKDSHGSMNHFIERFRSRVVEIACRDSEPGVRASAVELVGLIRGAGMIEPDEIDMIGRLIYDSEPRVRKAVVGFFVEGVYELYDSKVEELGGKEEVEEMLTVDDDEDLDSPRAGWIVLKSLAEILSSYDAEDQDEMPSQINFSGDHNLLDVSSIESRFSLAAQALYEKMPELKDWEMLAAYLLFDHSANTKGSKTDRALKESFKPTEQEEVLLLEVLHAVVKSSLTKADGSEKSKDRSKQKQLNAEFLQAKETTARRLSDLFPKLLKKFGANPKTATAVLRLEHVLNLGVFEELRQDSTGYAQLLDEISAQFKRHADRAVLSEAGAALLHAREYEELEEVTENKMQSLWEDATDTLRRISKAGEISVRGTFSVSVLTDLSHNLARLDKLASISNCVEPLEAGSGTNDPLPIDILLDIVARGVFQEEDPERTDLEDEVVLSAIRSSMFYFMWKVRSLTEAISSGTEIPDIDIDKLRDWQDTFRTNLVASLSSRSTLDQVRVLATGTLLDLHVLFATLRPAKKPKSKNGGSAKEASDENEYLETLIKEIPPDVQNELTSIFDLAEKQFAKRSKKKLAEPGEDEAPQDLDSESEDDEEEDATASERQAETLRAEQQLCELTGKLVLAILAKVIDASGPSKGKLRSRIERNRTRLGPNFKEVVAYLDEGKAKGKKSHRSKAEQAASAAKKEAKSKEHVEESEEEEEEEEEDPFAADEPGEGTAEDLRRRELLDDDPPVSVEDDEGEAAEEEEDIMGD